MLALGAIEETIREYVYGDTQQYDYRDATIWDVDDLLDARHEQAKDEARTYTQNVLDTVEDRWIAYDTKRNGMIAASDAVPSDETQDPAVTPGDFFYDGELLVHDRDPTADAIGEEVSDPDTIQYDGDKYTSLGTEGYWVELPGTDERKSLSLALYANGGTTTNKLANLEQFYREIADTAEQMQTGDGLVQPQQPATNATANATRVENRTNLQNDSQSETQTVPQLQHSTQFDDVGLDDLLTNTENRLQNADAGSAEHDLYQSTTGQVEAAQQYFDDQQQHYRSVADMFEQLQDIVEQQ